MLNMKKLFLLFVFGFVATISRAQTGGLNNFQNLNAFYHARIIGLGGDLIAVKDGDINLGLSNPALINAKMMGKGAINQSILSGGATTGSIAYGKTIKNVTSSLNFRYISYGKMTRTDINGTETGTFSPGDFIIGASAAKNINERLHFGATLNLLYSQLDNYTAFGTSLTIGGAYTNEEKRLVVGGVIKNLGLTIKSYTGTREPLPLSVEIGISKKLEHAPFRFSVTGQHLQRWDLSYVDPNQKNEIDPLTGDTIFVQRASFAEKVARHLRFQTELLFGPKFHLRVGFDYQRRKELAATNRPGLAGFSFGTGMYFKRFTLDYGWLIYSAAGFQHAIAITIPIGKP